MHAESVESAPQPGGWVAPGFEEVRAEFERNFAERGEIGAAVAAYWRGEKVVDLWGGRRTPDGDEPWNEDTMVVVLSTTKGLAAMTLAVANARGWLDYDAPVARYWPEFAQNGKAAITVRQLLGHEAGLVWLDETLRIEQLRDLDGVARLLARQKPAWPPGTRHGYHAMTIGLYMQELIRRVDPAHRTLGRFFQEEIAEPLGLDFYIGLPPEIPDERLAQLKTFLPGARSARCLRAATVPDADPVAVVAAAQVDAVRRPRPERPALPRGRGPGGQRRRHRARDRAGVLGVRRGRRGARHHAGDPRAPHRAAATPSVRGTRCWACRAASRSASCGRGRTRFRLEPARVRHAGRGGSFAFADPDARLGYAYVMNKMDFYLVDDPREKALRDAVYRAIKRLSRLKPRGPAGAWT